VRSLPAGCNPLLLSLEAKLTSWIGKAENIRVRDATFCILCVYVNPETRSLWLTSKLSALAIGSYKVGGQTGCRCAAVTCIRISQSALTFSLSNQCYFSGMNGQIKFDWPALGSSNPITLKVIYTPQVPSLVITK
jgi:hypothetical protein